MPRRIHRDWLESYLDLCTHSEAPDVLHFWTGVSTIAGALRRKVWIDQIFFRWTPNFYIIFVAPPGISTKSTSMDIGMDMLRKLKTIKFGPDSLSWQKLATAMADAREDFQHKGAFIPMSCLTFAASELGSLLKTKDQDMITLLTDLWDGKEAREWLKSTKTQGSDKLVNPWINILAATTPAWWEDNTSPAMLEGGLTSRCLFIYTDQKRSFEAYPAESVKRETFNAARDKLLHDLEIISKIKGEYKITPEAMKWGAVWYKRIYTEEYPRATSEAFRGYLSRKQTHVHKLAIVLAAAYKDDPLIELDDLQRAAKLVTALEDNMHSILNSAGANEEVKFRKQLVRIVKVNKRVPTSMIFRVLGVHMSLEAFQGALDSARAQGSITLEQEGSTVYAVYDSVNDPFFGRDDAE